MSKTLVLYDSRVDHIAWEEDTAVVHLSVGYIHEAKGKPGGAATAEWSQEANIILEHATLLGPVPPLPNTIDSGFLAVGGSWHEMIPLPFKRNKPGRLYLHFVDKSEIEISGELPRIDLLGSPLFLEKTG